MQIHRHWADMLRHVEKRVIRALLPWGDSTSLSRRDLECFGDSGEGGEAWEGLVFWEKMGMNGCPRLPWF